MTAVGMRRSLLSACVAILISRAAGQLCYDAAGHSFTGNDVAYFLDQRYNCTIMICRNGTPQVLKQLCPRELNETVILGMKPEVETMTGSCVPIHQCPEAVDQALVFCPLPSGEQGIVCMPGSDVTNFVPHEEYPKLETETKKALSVSALPRATKDILRSLPEETADGHSAAEAALQDAVQSASNSTREAVMQAADDYVGKMENSSDRLMTTGQRSSVNPTTDVFNLNFRISVDVQQLAVEAVRLLSRAALFISARDASSETTKEAAVETSTQPTPQPSEGPSESSKGPSDQSAADPTEGPIKDVPAGPTVQTEEETTGQSSDPTSTMVTVETGGQEGTDQSDSAPHSNQTCLSSEPPLCDPTAIYRPADGSCNNLRRPQWGSRRTPLRRIFQNTYKDGIFSPTSGASLPNPRLVSERLMDLEAVSARQRTLAVMTWGQFMDHDLVHTPIFQLEDGSGIECCPHRNTAPPETAVHPQCFPIAIREADEFYGPHLERCMNFVRSVPTPRPDCELGPANQLNDVTHWIDCSQVYGSSLEKQKSLRTFSGGLLRTSAGGLLPLEAPLSSGDGTNTTSCRGHVCFVAGDSRVNENPMLTMYHTLFVREHNRIAKKLQYYAANRSSAATDEDLFQRARRIVIAEWQHITYNEWLPALLGYSYAESVGLSKTYGIPSSEYLDFLNPSISNSFATAGFRLHSLVQDMLHFVSASGNTTTMVPLHKTFFEPSVLLSGGAGGTDADGGGGETTDAVGGGVGTDDAAEGSSRIARLARGITRQMPRVQDRHFSGQVRGQLFATDCVGLDLVTLNVQRGRDHGLAKYHTVLRWCTGVAITHWSDLTVVMTAENVARLKAVYSHWAEVDMFTGINMERLVPGAMLGPTARCLITEQFVRLRFGDRFFYDLGGQPSSFTKDQVIQLGRASWGRLLCDTVGEDFSAVQPLAFFQPNDVFNPVTDCHLLPGLDLSRF